MTPKTRDEEKVDRAAKPPGWAKDDPLEQELLEDLSRMRQADLERTLCEYEQEDRACSSSSSTPIA